jgi:hypothetical protein
MESKAGQRQTLDALNSEYGKAIMTDENTTQRIRERAYQLYLDRGREPGRDLEDWTTAEEEELFFGTDRSEWQIAKEEETLAHTGAGKA